LPGLEPQKRERKSLEGEQGPGKAEAGAIQEEAHAQGLSALDSHHAHVSADMVAVDEQRCLGLVAFSIMLQPGNAFFYGAAKMRADLDVFKGCVIVNHGSLVRLKPEQQQKKYAAASSFYSICR
jgi:hypothetical protein